VLIATLATLLLTSGAIVTGELLRMTAPRASVMLAARPASIDAPSIVPALPVESSESPATMPIAPHTDASRTNTAATRSEIEQLADDLAGRAEAARKLTVLGTAPGEGITLTALTLARLLARQAKVVVVDLSGATPTIAAASVDQTAPGLAELMQGQASFAQIISKDRLSRVHLVSAGRPGFDRTQLQSPRLILTIDALLRVYDHVLLDVGTGSDLPADLLTSQARAVVVPDPSMAPDARAAMCDQFRAVGFAEVTMLNEPYQSLEAVEPSPRVVAA
jgi:polysaccharide biosynthesis transport protein